MKLEFLFIAGRREEKYNLFGLYPHVHCQTCIHGISYGNTYACAHPTLINHVYPSCYKSRSFNTYFEWRKL